MDSSSTSHSSNKVGAVDVRVRALQQLEGADAVRIAEEVLHELSAPQSHGVLNSRREVACEVAVPP